MHEALYEIAREMLKVCQAAFCFEDETRLAMLSVLKAVFRTSSIWTAFLHRKKRIFRCNKCRITDQRTSVHLFTELQTSFLIFIKCLF